MTYKVYAIDQYGRHIIRRGLKEKAAYGLCSDYSTWGFRNISMAQEPDEAELAHRRACQLTVIVCIIGLLAAMCYGICKGF